MFKHLPGDTAVLLAKGRFRQCDVYTFQDQLFAKVGSSFVRLNADGSTSDPGQRILSLAYEGPLYADKFHRLCVEDGPARKPMFIDVKTDEFKALPVPSPAEKMAQMRQTLAG